ncbi:hypothetical protein [Tenacibaculum xiamenense]|uniref:hypothetical protein n=1 Tax=Tenacibaculum xiamenense TaxID=1261553 RepID=UPI003893965F
MRKSITKITSDISLQLNEISPIADQIQKKSTQSIRNFSNWLTTTEDVLKNLNLPESSKFSVKRSELSAFIPSAGGSKKKEHLFLTATLLTQAQQDLWEVFTAFNEKLENAKKLINQLLGLLYQTNEFKYDANEDFTVFIHDLWNFCHQHEQLKGITGQILSLVNKSDVIIIMANEIDLENL